jgi:hypothetical protein
MHDESVDFTKRKFLGAGLGTVALVATRFPSTARSETNGTRFLEYEITWQGQKIGNQSVEIESTDGGTKVRHRGLVSVHVFFVEAMRMEHESEELWEGDRLLSLNSRTVTNDAEVVVSGQQADSGFHILEPKAAPTGYRDVATLDSFWLLHSVRHSRLIDPKTGKVVTFEKEQIGSKGLDIAGETVQADGYRIAVGEDHANLWYHDGLLVASDVTQDGNTAHAVLVQ